MSSAALDRARVLADGERWDDALVTLRQHLTSAPDDAQALRLVAQCELGLQRPAPARRAAERSLAVDPDSEWGHRLLAIALRRDARYEEARRAIEEAIRLAPDSWRGYRERAEIDICDEFVSSRTWADARRAVELAPDEPIAQQTLGRLALVQKQNRVAVRAFREALRLDPQDATARNNLAVAQLRRRRLASAGVHLAGALRLDPTSGLFARNLGILLRIWATGLNLVGILACVIALNLTRDDVSTAPGPPVQRSVTLPPGAVISAAPDDIVTIGPTSGQTYTYDDVGPVARHDPQRGRPAVLTVSAVVVLAAALCVLLVLRRSLGRGARRIVGSYARRDSRLAVTALLGLSGTLGLVVAAGVGLPVARGVLGATIALDVVTTVVIRVMARYSDS